MTLRPWDELREEPLVRYKVFDVHKAVRRSPRNGEEIGFFLIRTWDWVNVVALTPREELLLVRQYRQGTREFTLEIPGGIVHGVDEPPIEAAARELREETGYVAAALTPIGVVRPNPAILTNRCHTFLATGCRRVGELQQDPGEDMEVVTVPLASVDEMVRRGEIDHALVVAALHFLRLHRGEGTPRPPGS